MSEDASVPIGDVDPEAGELSERGVADLREALTAEEALTRQQGARTCDLVVQENPEAVRPLIDDIAALLDDDSAAVAQQAVTVLLGIAGERPGDLTDVVPAILSITGHEVNAIRLFGAQILGAVVVDHPEAVASHVHRLIPDLHEHTGPFEASEVADMVENPDSRQSIVEHEQEEHRMKLQTQGTLANVVVAVAEAEPSALFDHVDELVELLDHDDPAIAGTVIDALIEVAEADPGVVEPAFDELVEALDHDDERVYVRSVRALGYLGDDREVGPLRDLAESASDEAVTELANDTADFLEDR